MFFEIGFADYKWQKIMQVRAAGKSKQWQFAHEVDRQIIVCLI